MAQQKSDQGQQAELDQMEAAAERMGNAARTGAEAEADALRESGQTIGRSMQETARATQRGIDASGQAVRRGIEDVGQSAQTLAEASADQFTRMGEMMADAARDAAESAHMMVTFSNFTNEGLRGMQEATSNLLQRVVQTNVRAMQEMVQHNSFGELASRQQRFIREYLQTMVQGSAELVRAAQELANEAVRPLEQQARAEEERRQRRRQPHLQQGKRIADVMSREVRTVRPDDTVQRAAQLMGSEDTGALPVAEDGRVLGMVTDRDIAIRLASTAKDPAKTRVRDVMSQEVQYCLDDEDVQHIAEIMADQQLRRLPVMDRHQNLVGIVSIGDLAERESSEMAGEALAGVARHTGQHAQHANRPRRK
ncbi:CBS domain-containing protein [Azospirillum sp. sgz301742]